MTSSASRFVRLVETQRPAISISVDGEEVNALAGDSLLVAVLTHRGHLRQSEFGPEARSGFCLMAACQDCWMWTPDGDRIRACDTPVQPGLAVLTEPPGLPWPRRA
jgi:predicted molibdopterin-dependent oxidoreductase YjgC